MYIKRLTLFLLQDATYWIHYDNGLVYIRPARPFSVTNVEQQLIQMYSFQPQGNNKLDSQSALLCAQDRRNSQQQFNVGLFKSRAEAPCPETEGCQPVTKSLFTSAGHSWLSLGAARQQPVLAYIQPDRPRCPAF